MVIHKLKNLSFAVVRAAYNNFLLPFRAVYIQGRLTFKGSLQSDKNVKYKKHNYLARFEWMRLLKLTCFDMWGLG